MFGSTSNNSAGSSTEPSFLPAGVWTSIFSDFWVLSAILLFASLDCGADHDQSTGAPGDRALDQQHAVLGIDLVYQQVLRRHAVVAHPARHARALEHPARGGAATDGAGTTVHRLRTVAGALAAE